MLSDSTTTLNPIIKDSRAPCISRERMSRPISSVPRGKRHVPPSTQTGGVSWWSL